MLKDIANYIKTNPDYSSHTLYTIKRLTIEHKLTVEEVEVLIDLIKGLSTWGRMYLGHEFASALQALPDQRLRDFIYRPFYNETPLEFMAERATILLGFLNNETCTFHDLPMTVQEFDNSHNIEASIAKYISAEDDTFRKLFILAAYGYQEVYHIGQGNLRTNPVVVDQVRYFSRSDTVEDAVLIGDVVINRGYSQTNEPRFGEDDEWFQLVKLFLYNQTSDIGKRVCEIVIANNIWSSVHTSRDFLRLLYFLLNHEDPEVEQHAFRLFNENFQAIWKRVLHPRYPQSWQEEIKKTWFSKEFVMKLQERSEAFSLWLSSRRMLDIAQDYWDEMPNDGRIALIDFFSQMALTENLEQVELAKSFLDDVEKKISPQSRKKLKDAIFVEEETYRQELRGQSKQIDRRKDLAALLPQIDWDMYLS